MSEEKVAFVFDTNFILQNKKLNAVIKQLDEKYIPYVTQVSIEERKAQQCLERKKEYDKVKEAKNMIASLVTLRDSKALEEELEKHKANIQLLYENYFEGRIIKYEISSECFQSILLRAFEKIPPFNDNDKASDKGFKDTIIWLSLLEFFKNNGENEVIFLTDDNGFLNKGDYLTKEFETYTGKKIQIKKNSTFDTLLESHKALDPAPKKEIPNIEHIREQLRDLLEKICRTTEPSYWDEVTYCKNFSTSILFDELYIKSVLENLETVIHDHKFNDRIKVSVFLDRDNRIYNDKEISMSHIEKLNKLSKDILENYPDYYSALINFLTDKLNENYEETDVFVETDIPF